MASRLSLILGPMFSGKSTELRRLAERATRGGKICITINYAGDNRYTEDSKLMTHSGQSWPAYKYDTLCSIDEKSLNNVEYIFIDEGQFFPDIHAFCLLWLAKGKKITVAALNGTSELQSFDSILSIISLSTSINLLSAVCYNCGNDAYYSIFVAGTKQVKNRIGGSESYKASCFECRESVEAVNVESDEVEANG